MNDPIDLVRSNTPKGAPSDELLARVRSDLMSTITATENPPVAAPQDGRKRRWLLPVAAAALFVTSAGAWAATRADGPADLHVGCPADRDGNITIIGAVRGDPVADCAAEWADTHEGPVPAMTAYVNGDGAISVQMAGESPPDGFVALTGAPGPATAVIRLRESLDDAAGPLVAGCLSETAARPAVQRELDRLALGGWTIAVDGEHPLTQERPCARAIVDPALQRVVLLGDAAPVVASDPYAQFARELDAELSSSCVDLADAQLVVERVAAETDVSSLTDVPFTVEAGLLHITAVDEPTAPCTTGSVSVGGRVEVILRGPLP